MGRDASGVRGIKLRETDEVIGMVAFERDSQESLVTVCERGYGKRTKLSEFAAKNRGGLGMISVKCSSRNGLVTGVRLANEEDHLILISNKGKLIRMRAADISLVGRNTQGVRVMRLDENEVVASIERLADPEEDAGDIEAPEEGAPVAVDEVEGGDTVPVDMTAAISAEVEAAADDEGEGE